jgi:hydrogenase nickel incorporation protein HypA/HybF
MHEVALARALIELVGRHAPCGGTVRAVHVRAGPLRAIDPEAMRWAWQATVRATPYEGARLNWIQLPWTLQCPDCGAKWESEDLFADCLCGGVRSRPAGGDELVLEALDVDESVGPGASLAEGSS